MPSQTFPGDFKPHLLMEELQEKVPELFVVPRVPHPKFPTAKEALFTLTFHDDYVLAGMVRARSVTIAVFEDPPGQVDPRLPADILDRIEAAIGAHSPEPLSYHEVREMDEAQKFDTARGKLLALGLTAEDVKVLIQ